MSGWPRYRSGLAAAAAVVVAAITAAVVFGWPGSGSGNASGRPSAPPAAGPAGDPAPSSTLAPPATGAYLGAWVAPVLYTQPGRVLAVTTLQQQLGRRLDILHIYLRQPAEFPTASDLAFARQGSALLVSWALNGSGAIAAGQDDAEITQRAQEIKALGTPVFLEWRWEMDRPNLRAQVGTPAAYIAAWKHIRAVFAGQGVRNVAWVWCPTARGFANGTAQAYYPGDDQVNWVCADAYPRAGPLQSFASIIAPFMAWAARPGKPVMIGEYGVPLSYSAADRAQWLRDAAQTVRADPQIRALLYFDGPGTAPGSSFILSDDPLQAFRAMADDPYFNPGNVPVTPAP